MSKPFVHSKSAARVALTAAPAVPVVPAAPAAPAVPATPATPATTKPYVKGDEEGSEPFRATGAGTVVKDGKVIIPATKPGGFRWGRTFPAVSGWLVFATERKANALIVPVGDALTLPMDRYSKCRFVRSHDFAAVLEHIRK